MEPRVQNSWEDKCKKRLLGFHARPFGVPGVTFSNNPIPCTTPCTIAFPPLYGHAFCKFPINLWDYA